MYRGPTPSWTSRGLSANVRSTHLPGRFKMMYDDDTLYVSAEFIDPKIWGTITEKNSTMYHKNEALPCFNAYYSYQPHVWMRR
ncbi:TKL protein kinase [Phytophthora cinnamomi]|uniref:TKL protein kinase n=1 Tax=Phytophthora cinnamomi TaxID=4785 RepID=UPI00355A49EC|nr:TKL protein kinase [Phytophthora cinnamomi]